MDGAEFEAKITQLQVDQYKELIAGSKARRGGNQSKADDHSIAIFHRDREIAAIMKAEGKRFSKELKIDLAASDDQKVEQLLQAFVRGLRLERIWKDVVMENRMSYRCGQMVVDKIQPALDAMNRRGDLVKFLDHPDLGVRATAASWLANRMPEVCVPILRDINKSETAWKSAGLTAFWALAMYEQETQKAG